MITANNIKRYIRNQATNLVLTPLISSITSYAQSEAAMKLPLKAAIGLTVVSAAASVYAYQVRRSEKQRAVVDQLINIDHGLATDHLEEGFGAPMVDEDGMITGFNETREPDNGRAVPTAEPSEMAVIEGLNLPLAVIPGPDHQQEGTSETSLRSVGRLVHTPVEVRQQRRVRRGAGMKYMGCVIAECKAKFVAIDRNPTSIKAVNRFAASIMQKHGLRPAHIQQYLPMIVSMTFVPTNAEMEAVRLLNSLPSTERRLEYLVQQAISTVAQANC